MTSLFSQGAPPTGASSTSVTTGRTDGIQFTVSTACNLTGFWWYNPSIGGTGDAPNYTGYLWSTTNGTTGTLLGSQVASGTWVVGGWNFWALATPIALSPGTTYVAGVGTPSGSNHNLEFLHSAWNSGGVYAAGVTNGPLTAPGSATALNLSQQPTAPSNGAFPPNQSTFSWYGIDVEVSSGVTVTGAVASLTLSAPAGSAVSGGVLVQGAVATLGLSALAGSAVAGHPDITVAGAVSSLALTAFPGVVLDGTETVLCVRIDGGLTPPAQIPVELINDRTGLGKPPGWALCLQVMADPMNPGEYLLCGWLPALPRLIPRPNP